VLPYDYPVLFWLRPLFGVELGVFDLGGNVGVHYYGYRKYLPYTDSMRWTVCEIPLLIAKGKNIAAEREAAHLAFTEHLADADGYDVLLAAGVLHFIDAPTLAEGLKPMSRKPKHVLLNKLPLYEGEDFVTLQNAGLTTLPHHVYDRSRFLASFTSLGYELVDEWVIPDFSCVIPGHPDKRVPAYSGCYLRLRP
jgi:putative methyltransferase (TIGR04325 family)